MAELVVNAATGAQAGPPSDDGPYVVALSGCTPTLLASYLKALGILRLVSEQADPDAKGRWGDSGFTLTSRLDLPSLEEFFLEQYRPTPRNAGGLMRTLSTAS